MEDFQLSEFQRNKVLKVFTTFFGEYVNFTILTFIY